MIYFVLSRNCYEQLAASSGLLPVTLWINGGILSASELSDLRARSLNVTDFAGQIDPADPAEVGAAMDTIRLHHPGQVVWVEHAREA